MLALLLALVPPQAPGTGERPILVESIAAQCGDALVTSRELEAAFQRASARRPPRSREEAERMQRELLSQLTVLRLEEQAGADLGIAREQIELINRVNVRESRERQGLQTYLAELQKEGKDALLDERDSERQLLRAIWEYSVQGNSVAGRRPTKDRTIRPGELRVLYAQNRERLDPTTVQMRWLVVASRAAGSPEAARASCEEARARVLAGEDLALIVEERGNDLRESRGLGPHWPLEAYRQQTPEMADFAASAEIGDVSEVVPLTNARTGQPDPELGYQIAQVHDRKDPEPPEFERADVQRILRDVYVSQRREAILGRERSELRRSAYVWIDPTLGGTAVPGAAPGAAAP